VPEKVLAQFFVGDLLHRFLNVPAEFANRTEIGILGAFGITEELHIFD